MPANSIDNFNSTQLPAVSKWRWIGALISGFVLSVIADISSQFIPMVILGLPLNGLTFALVGVLKMILGLLAVSLGLRVVGLRFRDVGFVATNLSKDVRIGIGIAVGYAAFQFLVVMPLTGGAGREDIVVDSARIGESISGVFGFIALAWTGVFFEELLFRGLIFKTINESLGSSRAAIVTTIILTATIFALLHGYQGWAGVIDTGIFGGLGLTLLYLWRGRRLASCIVAHALWNTIATIGIYLLY